MYSKDIKMIKLNGREINSKIKRGSIKKLIELLGLREEEVVVMKNKEVLLNIDIEFNEKDLIEIIEATSKG